MDTNVHVHMDFVESLGNILYTLKDRKRKQMLKKYKDCKYWKKIIYYPILF